MARDTREASEENKLGFKPHSLDKLCNILKIEPSISIEEFKKQNQREIEEAYSKFQQSLETKRKEPQKISLQELNEEREKGWQMMLHPKENKRTEWQEHFNTERNKTLSFLSQNGITDSEKILHSFELAYWGRGYIEGNHYHDWNVHMREIYSFYKDILSSKETLDVLKYADSNYFVFERLLDLEGWNLDDWNYSTKKLQNNPVLKELAAIPQEQYESVLSELNKYFFLFPGYTHGMDQDKGFDLALYFLKKGSISPEEKKSLDSLLSLLNVNWEYIFAIINHPIFRNLTPQNISKMGDRIQDEITVWKSLICHSMKRQAPSWIADASIENRIQSGDVEQKIQYLQDQNLLHPLAELLRSGMKPSRYIEVLTRDRGKTIESGNLSDLGVSIQSLSRRDDFIEKNQKQLSLFKKLNLIKDYDLLDPYLIKVKELQKPETIQRIEILTSLMIKLLPQETNIFDRCGEYLNLTSYGFGIDLESLSKTIQESIGTSSLTIADQEFWKMWSSISSYEHELVGYLFTHPNWEESFQFLIERFNFDFISKYLSKKEVQDSLSAPFKEFCQIWITLDKKDRNVLRTLLQKVDFSSENIKNVKSIISIYRQISESSSKELRAFKEQILDLLLSSPNPLESFEQIRSVFELNNIPEVGKIFRVFEILYPPDRLSKTLETESSRRSVSHDETSTLSPILIKSSQRRRYDIIYRDLLKVHIKTGNPSLLGYVKTLQEGEQVLQKVEKQSIENLVPDEMTQLDRFLNRMDTLYSNSLYGRIRKEPSTKSLDSLSRIRILKEKMGIKADELLTERIIAMFLRPLGLNTFDEVLDTVNRSRQEANLRNVEYVANALQNNNGHLNLNTGDLLKGIESEYFENILSNGSVSKEYLGPSSSSDTTPFDTDVSRILNPRLNTLPAMIDDSLAKGYGDIIIGIRNRGQFYQTSNISASFYDQTKYELFQSRYHGPQHYGIRTGIPATEIDCVIVQNKSDVELHRLYFAIAQNGFYIPVVDRQGKVLLTPEMFDQFKVKPEILPILNSQEFNPKELLEALKKSPFIDYLFNSSTGVGEGYTLEEHTIMVMNQYEKYFSGRWKSPILSQEGFRLLLSLHDLGKPLALKVKGNTSEQHEYTMKLIPKILETLNVNVKEAEIIAGIINQDFLGDYVKGIESIELTGRRINIRAKELGVPITQFFELLKMYFICDAGSYTLDAGGQAALDNLFIFDKQNSNVRFSQNTNSEIERLIPYLFLE